MATQTAIDFKAIFEALPGLYLILAPDAPHFTILGGSDAYFNATLTKRENLVGIGLFEAFPDNPGDVKADGVMTLKGSLLEAMRSHAPHTMAVQKYDIPLAEEDGGGFEARYWAPVNSPVMTSHNEIQYLLHRVEDVTGFYRREEERKKSASSDELGKSTPLVAVEDLDITGQAGSLLLNLISDREQAQLAMQSSEERFRTLVDNLPIIIWTTNTEGRLNFVNQYWAEFSGEPIEAAFRPNAMHYVHPDDHEIVIDFFKRIVAEQADFNAEYRRLYNDGSYRWIQTHAKPTYHADGSFLGYLGFSMDVNEEKLLQDQLFESQKMESLGRLAGGIAHDFNNLLTAILGYTEIVMESLPDDTPLRALLGNVTSAGQRASDLTRQLLMYARRQMVEFRDVDLGQIVRNLVPILYKTIGEQFELVTNWADEDCHAFTNAGQIEQVIMNLVVNARDAMPEGGRLLLETAVVTLDEDYVSTHFSATPGEYVMVSVSDTGVGMTQEVLSRIFEPFYTTKEVGKGTGLGLATSYGIVKQSKGNIWVYSEPGRGTTFKIYLPRVRSSAVENDAAQIQPLVRGAETLLLVDDELMIRDIAARILRKNGYRVLEARNGADALQVQSEWEEEIDLLITDVVMPLMGGRELGDRIKRLRPNVKTLYMSGYTHSVIVQEGVLEEGVVLLTKPFNAANLLGKVREALEARKSELPER